MNLLYCGDANIRDGLLLSLMSIVRHNVCPLNVYILTLSLDMEECTCLPLSDTVILQAESIVKTVNPESTVSKIDMTEIFRQDMPQANLGTRFTPCCMLRLYADELPQIPERILYLDTDVLCRESLSEFYGQDLTDCEFAGVLDYYGSWFFRRNLFRRDYCNSGVMLLNMEKIRETGLFRSCRKRCREKRMFMPDQSALNKLSVSKRLMPRRYNEQRELHSDTVLQHFTTSFRFFPVFRIVSVKPWNFEEVHSVLELYEYDGLFDEYRQLIHSPAIYEFK